jgi:hypothetical protein
VTWEPKLPPTPPKTVTELIRHFAVADIPVAIAREAEHWRVLRFRHVNNIPTDVAGRGPFRVPLNAARPTD